MLGLLNDRVLLLILAFTAGFVDTATFVGADHVFSAHVTGNFVVFASTIASGEHDGLVKLLTFPFFALGVLFVGILQDKLCKKKGFFTIISVIVILSGGGFFYFKDGLGFQVCVMGLVTAMGMQNAAHKLYLKGTPTSTVMTGNVTQFFLDIVSPIKSAVYFSTIEMVLSFFVGCMAAAFFGLQFGITSILIPGFILLTVSLLMKRSLN